GLYSTEGPVTEEEELTEIGKCAVCREGDDLTIVAAGSTLVTSMECAKTLEQRGVDAEVIDLQSLWPFDSKTIIGSIEKTGRLVVVEDDVGFLGWGAEVAAQAGERALYSLKAPIRRVSAPYSPVPFSPALEREFLPSSQRILEGCAEV